MCGKSSMQRGASSSRASQFTVTVPNHSRRCRSWKMNASPTVASARCDWHDAAPRLFLVLLGALFLFIQHRTEGKRIARRIRLGLFEFLVTLVNLLERVEEPLARLGELGTRHEPATTAELQRQEYGNLGRNWTELGRDERRGLVRQTYQIGTKATVRVDCAEHLLFPRQGKLSLGSLDSRNAVVFVQLVGEVKRWSIATHDHLGTNAENIDRRAFSDQIVNFVFVKIPACEDRRVLKTVAIKDGPRLDTQVGEIAAVEPYTLQLKALPTHLIRDCDGILHAADGVVGIDQKCAELGEILHEVLEGLALSVVRHDVAVSHSAVKRDTVTPSSKNIGCTIETSKVTRTRRYQACGLALAASESEINESLAARRDHAARCLARDERGHSDLIDSQRLDQLRLD